MEEQFDDTFSAQCTDEFAKFAVETATQATKVAHRPRTHTASTHAAYEYFGRCLLAVLLLKSEAKTKDAHLHLTWKSARIPAFRVHSGFSGRLDQIVIQECRAAGAKFAPEGVNGMNQRASTVGADFGTERDLPTGMVLLSGGKFRMGSNKHYPEESPAHWVIVDVFAIDATAVTNLDFANFVAATGYVMVAERPLNAADFPGAKPEMLKPGSMVFQQPPGPVDLRNYANWWAYIPGACWDQRLVCGGPCTGCRQTMLRSAKPARRRRGAELRPSAAPVPHSTQGREGWIIPVRAQLLPSLSASRAPTADDRHLNVACRLSLRRSTLTS